MEYFLHSVKSKQLYFMLITYLIFSKKLGHNLSNSSVDSKLGFFKCWSQVIFPRFFPNLQKIFWGFECCSIWTSTYKKWKTWIFEYKTRLHFQFFPNFFSKYFQRAGKLEILRSLLFHILLDCENSLSGTVCLQKREVDPIY